MYYLTLSKGKLPSDWNCFFTVGSLLALTGTVMLGRFQGLEMAHVEPAQISVRDLAGTESER